MELHSTHTWMIVNGAPESAFRERAEDARRLEAWIEEGNTSEVTNYFTRVLSEIPVEFPTLRQAVQADRDSAKAALDRRAEFAAHDARMARTRAEFDKLAYTTSAKFEAHSLRMEAARASFEEMEKRVAEMQAGHGRLAAFAAQHFTGIL
jgi:hypothetical protein